MRRIVVISIIVIILGAAALAGLEWAARLEKKHPGVIEYSGSAEESRKNNFYITDYRALQDTIKLSQQPGIIHFHSAFAERGWRIDTSTLYLFAKKIPADAFNIIINYTAMPGNTGLNFDLVPLNDSNVNAGVTHYGSKILLHRTDHLQDTFWFRLFEKNKDSVQGWTEADDVIGFTKSK